ncbi:WLM-domain-containing protein [Dissoconium aciculare CBS 342.82]|uniref:WLM-domain-containing protein n=1 Tax=Dissoconium aciculare CBS 342.82 TaxID=1314786 RepID=A0A6J3MBC9_9PEZI|nr:WLM-domain-containing protein [Dissoconium aciculare CBS 342.82]KAF1824939.1 WLM-domain-containing protein [Dissoconium aciculare CBS 342.82]
MPLGFERLNERQQRPNANINFIKPLETADKAIAEDFLQRIAAQCYPVMKKNHISVMSLEEYPPNPEFLGRNFNAGEVIQLVLKNKQGQWLSMKFVQMVMMHELAHCKQMNHSRYFWNVRNEYAKEMEELWRQKYVGEGMWGRGRGLNSGLFIHDRAPDNSEIPEHLCGGSYRRRGHKRKRGAAVGSETQEKLTYAERQQRRIARKFGKHGEGSSLGDDELLRGALETMNGGKRSAGKPRVANSKRGRELRANAALARFEQNKIKKEELCDGSETESDWEDNDQPRIYAEDGVRIKDEHGHDLIKVCGEGGEDEEDSAKDEMNELRQLGCVRGQKPSADSTIKTEEIDGSETESEAGDSNTSMDTDHARLKIREDQKSVVEPRSETESEVEDIPEKITRNTPAAVNGSPYSTLNAHLQANDSITTRRTGASPVVEPNMPDQPATSMATTTALSSVSLICPICSLENNEASPTCIACSHVLLPHLIPNHWRCQSETCKMSEYINAGDVGRCNLCGAQKPKAISSAPAATGRDFGITRADILRWD